MLNVISKNRNIDCSINLPSSKSESNRALLIKYLTPESISIKHLSNSTDTCSLFTSLRDIIRYIRKGKLSDTLSLNIGHAGTCMRFLTAFLSIQPGRYLLTGSSRMQERPIKILVDSLRELGANIEYLKKEGFPPLKIVGNSSLSQNQTMHIKADVSSQYISALLLIAPKLSTGLSLTLQEPISAKPYINITLDLMKKAGIEYEYNKNTITIKQQNYKACVLDIGKDWSAASFWYSVAALSNSAYIKLYNLKKDSLQGDKIITQLMQKVGVDTSFVNNNYAVLTKPYEDQQKRPTHQPSCYGSIDFTDFPDLALPVITTLTLLNKKAYFSGLHSLRIKESDRLQALQNGLDQVGYRLEASYFSNNSVFYTYRPLLYLNRYVKRQPSIRTYDDHRIAMSFAPLVLKLRKMQIQSPEVVDKSYPNFWQDLQKVCELVYTN